MRGVNKVIIIGNLGADPEARQFNNGGSVTNISVATSEQWTDKQSGEKREATEWHRISLFNRLGEIAAQYLRKGSKVYIEGSLRTRKYQDPNGQDRYITEIRAEQMQMLDGAMVVKVIIALAVKIRVKVVAMAIKVVKAIKTTLVSKQTISQHSKAVTTSQLLKVVKTALTIKAHLLSRINLINLRKSLHSQSRQQCQTVLSMMIFRSEDIP